MSIQLLGDSLTVGEVDANTRALHVDLRPSEIDGGAYAMSLASDVMSAGLAAGAEVFHFRWTDADYLAIVERVRIWAGGVVGFTAGFCKFDLSVARGWSALGASAGANPTLGSDAAKLRTSFQTTRIESDAIEISKTVALNAGTKNLDAVAVGSGGGSTRGSSSAGDKLVVPSAELFRADGRRNPLVLRANEGVVIRATVPASGTWKFGVDIEWAEVTAY
jgi:hypothetical protein